MGGLGNARVGKSEDLPSVNGGKRWFEQFDPRPPLLGDRSGVARSLVLSAGSGGCVAICYFVAQMATGTDLLVNTLFSVAIFAGTAAIGIGGGLRSMIGLLNLSLIGKYLLLSLALKVAYGQASETFLAAPLMTPLVICVAFLAIAAATFVVRISSLNKMPICAPLWDPNELKMLFWLTFVMGNGATLIAEVPWLGMRSQEVDFSVGGLVGVSRYMEMLRDFAVAVAIIYANQTDSKRLLSHPLVIIAIVVDLVGSIGSGSKQQIMNPALFAGLAIFAVKGYKYIPFYVIAIISWIGLSVVVFPAINYTRSAEFAKTQQATDNPIAEYLYVLKETIVDSDYRAAATAAAVDNYQENLYFNRPIGPAARFCLIGDADNLIAPTYFKQDFTGWYSIIWGLRMLPPRFLYKDKPVMDSSLELSIRSGLVDPLTAGVPLAFGFIACMYNSFGLVLGAGLGCFCFALLFYGAAKVFFGSAINGNVWLVFVVGWWHHPWAEATVSGVIAGMWYLAIAWILDRACRRLPHIMRGVV